MPYFSLTQETTGNTNTGGVLQWLMPAGRECWLVAVMLRLVSEAANLDIGRFVLDRISAVGATNWDTLVPLEMEGGRAPSAITSTTATVENTCNGQAGTVVGSDSAIWDFNQGWNDLRTIHGRGICSGIAQGFQIRRATAPSGNRIVVATAIWEE